MSLVNAHRLQIDGIEVKISYPTFDLKRQKE